MFAGSDTAAFPPPTYSSPSPCRKCPLSWVKTHGGVAQSGLSRAAAAQGDRGAVAKGVLVEDGLAVGDSGDGRGATRKAPRAALAVGARGTGPHVEEILPERVAGRELCRRIEERPEHDRLQGIGESLIVGSKIGIREKTDVDSLSRGRTGRRVRMPHHGPRRLPGDGDGGPRPHVQLRLCQRCARGVGDRGETGGTPCAVRGRYRVGDEALVAELQRQRACDLALGVVESADPGAGDCVRAARDQAGHDAILGARGELAFDRVDTNLRDPLVAILGARRDRREVRRRAVERVMQSREGGSARAARERRHRRQGEAARREPQRKERGKA